MNSPDFPADEASRLLALKRTALLDSPPEERFDRITRLAASVFNVDICLVSLVDSDRQWFKSKVGIDDCQTSRSISFCGHAILQNDVLIVQNATKDARFSDNPLVLQKPNIRFYAGAPLREPGGQPIGTLCLIDPEEREFSQREKQQLRGFADLVEHEIAKIDIEHLEQRLMTSNLRTASIIESLPDMVFVIDTHHRFTLCNEHPDLLKPKDEVLGQKLFDVLPFELANQMNRYVEKAFNSNTLLQHQYTLNKLKQSFEARYQKLNNSEVLVIVRNITNEKHKDDIISDNQHLLDAVIDTNNIGVWRLNLQDDQLIVNEKWATLLGYELSELMPINRQTWECLTHPDDLVYAAQQIDEYALGLTSHYDVNIRMKHKNGQWKWINTRGKVASNSQNGDVEWLLGTHFSIDEQLQAESQLKETSSKMSAVVDNLLDGIITIDSSGIMLTANQAAQSIFGYSHRELIGQNVNMLMGSPHREHHDTYLANYLSRGISNITGQIRELDAQRKDGSTFPIELGVVEVSLNDDINFIGIVRDISERKKREDKIHQLAFYDPLTSLPNRRLLLDRLYQAQSGCSRTGAHAALLFLDLDNFKDFNDSAGHDKGDLLLCQVAERLVQATRHGDTVARLGGDEFVILMTELSNTEEVAAVQSETLAVKLLTKVSQLYDIEAISYQCSASIGITIFNRSADVVGDLLKQADMAMYKAKATGRNRVCFFNPKMQADVNTKAEIIQELYTAISNEQFELYYQKQIDDQGHAIGVEVLLRWCHPMKGMISPAQFIPIAEDTGLIVPIGQWVLQQACQTLASWANESATEALTIAVNISAIQFNKNNFVQTVLDALHKTGANPRRLKLELTESMLVSDIADIKTKMSALQQHGVMFTIDDFGTGYSSLFYLKQLPLNQLKIDQAFVRDILVDDNDRAIAQSVITLSQSLKLEVIAEGVETQAQRALLQSMGCSAYQGYLFGKPCSIDELEI